MLLIYFRVSGFVRDFGILLSSTFTIAFSSESDIAITAEHGLLQSHKYPHTP